MDRKSRMIEITDEICISEQELVFKFSRSSGPGGQNVNKVNTRVTVLLDVASCESFSDIQKKRILRHLASRASKNGVIRVVAQGHRTQKVNRAAAVERLVELLQNALKIRAIRKKTKVPQRARQQRLDEKKHRGFLKKQRAKVDLGAED